MRKKVKLPDDYLEQFFDLLQKSYSLKEIAKELNISYAHIRRIASRFYSQYEVDGISGLVAKKDQVISENSRKKD
jgi:transposase